LKAGNWKIFISHWFFKFFEGGRKLGGGWEKAGRRRRRLGGGKY